MIFTNGYKVWYGVWYLALCVKNYDKQEQDLPQNFKDFSSSTCKKFLWVKVILYQNVLLLLALKLLLCHLFSNKCLIHLEELL